MHQTAVHEGVAPYLPNSLDGGDPLVTGGEEGAYVQRTPRWSTGTKVGAPGVVRRPLLPGDPVLRSLTPVEQDHIVEAFTFELGKCLSRRSGNGCSQILRMSTKSSASGSRTASRCGPPR